MAVDSTNSEYSNNLGTWHMVDDCNNGSVAIKARSGPHGAGTKYLPKPNSTDYSQANTVRFQDYLMRALFVGFTASTLEGMLGLVFKKNTEYNLDPSIDYIKDDADGGGLSLNQLTKSILSETILKGRSGLLVDYPMADEGLTKAQVESSGSQASIKTYPAESIINWRAASDGSLNLVVLAESHEIIDDDGFGGTSETYHRVLKLEDGIYIQELYNEKNEIVSRNENIRDASGANFLEIPFVFIGSRDNKPNVDKSPLADIAEINIAHYRNSADLEESSYLVGQPTPVITGLTQSWIEDNYSDGIALGSRSGLLLPIDGSAMLLQASPNQLPAEIMKRKEEQIVSIGARLITDSGGAETAEAAKIRFAGANSKLAAIIGNVEDGICKVLGWASQFMGGTGESTININRSFYDKSVDPQVIMASIALLDRGVVAVNDLRDDLRKSGFIAEGRTNEELENEAEQSNPLA